MTKPAMLYSERAYVPDADGRRDACHHVARWLDHRRVESRARDCERAIMAARRMGEGR